LHRQRVIVSLGDAKLPEAEKSLIASAVERRTHGGSDFFDSSLSPEASSWADRIVHLAGRSHAAKSVPQTTADGVILDSIETTDVVELGPELVALKAWEELRFTPMLEALGMNPSAISTAQLMVSNRLIEPLSEWALIDWSHRTALPELIAIAKPFYFAHHAGQMAVASSIEARSGDKTIRVGFSNSYRGTSDDAAILRAAGEAGARFFKQSFELKIKGDLIPEAAVEELIGELQGLFARHNAGAALSAKAVFKPNKDFHTARHTLFTPEQNLEIDKIVPVGASVKTKLGRSGEE